MTASETSRVAASDCQSEKSKDDNRLNFLGDLSPNGLAQSHGLMAHYLYSIHKIEKNHEVFAESGQVVASSEIRRTLRGDLASSDLVAAR